MSDRMVVQHVTGRAGGWSGLCPHIVTGVMYILCGHCAAWEINTAI